MPFALGQTYPQIEVVAVNDGCDDDTDAVAGRFGIPNYLKIDIEGMDTVVVRALGEFQDRPRYVSVETNRADPFAELWAVGAKALMLVNQRALHTIWCPNPLREGVYVDATFDGFASGPFGEETPGTWDDFDTAVERFPTDVRSPTRGYLAGHDWYDIHGRIG